MCIEVCTLIYAIYSEIVRQLLIVVLKNETINNVHQAYLKFRI